MTFASAVLSFYQSLELKVRLPKGVDLLNPYQHEPVKTYCKQFYNSYYQDSNPRTLILGINPGRLGAGLTGIGFTDPVQLTNACGIENSLPQKAELSSTFVYKMIDHYGGPTTFYQNFFLSAVCPLGFAQGGKNLNYYDLPALQQAVEPFIIESLKAQLKLGINATICFCLGEGKNFAYLKALNDKYGFFTNIIALPHPRFVMQYKRKQLNDYIDLYLHHLRQLPK